VEEWVSGQPLTAFSERLAGDEGRCSQLLALLARQLAVFHSSGIWHLDLKPDHVLASVGKCTLCFVDFEFAQLARDEGQPILGFTPLYASREQVQDGTAWPTTDVRALVLAMAECYIGHHPLIERLAGSDRMTTAQAVSETEIRFQSGSPFCSLIESMTGVDPYDRPQVDDVASQTAWRNQQ
jgi:serine/threonine protein kinase